ncbi:nuclear transport factor 2 family protein [Micromonospora sp. BRA006-A]|nr:nuclear transport factor 2 family protein [Micromonospora sp. BRA006-A]
METETVVRALWDRMQAWTGPASATCWPTTWWWSGRPAPSGSSAATTAVKVNAEYPEGWSIRVLRVVAAGDTVVSEVEVPHEGMGVHRVASFWTVRGGRIIEAGSTGPASARTRPRSGDPPGSSRCERRAVRRSWRSFVG